LELVGEIIIIVGIIFMLFGVIGIFKFRSFYPRILIASKIETVGTITVFLGVMVQNGWSFFTLRVLFLFLLTLIVSPMVTYIIVRFAYLSGYKLREEADKDESTEDFTE